MTIINAILKPYLNQLQADFEQLFQQIGFESDSGLTALKTEIQNHLRTISGIKTAVTILENHHETLAPFEVHAAYKAVKREHHAIKRTLARFNSNQERIRKMQEKRSHVAIFAA